MSIPTAEEIVDQAKTAGIEQDPEVKQWLEAVIQFPHEDWIREAAAQLIGTKASNYVQDPFAFRTEYVQPSINPQGFFQGYCDANEVYLPQEMRKRSEIVVGKPGTGKSTYVGQQVSQAVDKELVVWLFDFKDEHGGLADQKDIPTIHLTDLKLNPHELLRTADAVECLSHANLFQNASMGFYRDVVQRVSDVYGEQIFSVHHTRHLAQLMNPRKHTPDELQIDSYRQQTLMARDRVLRALDDMLGPYDSIVDCEHGYQIEDLAEQSIRFNCWGMAYKEAVYLIYVLLQALYTYRNQQRIEQEAFDQPLKNLVVIEEAKHVISRVMEEGMRTGPAFIRKITTEVRSSGIGYLFADQVPSALAPSAIESCNTLTLFRVGLEDDLQAIGGSMGLSEEQQDKIYQLADRTAITKHGEKRPIRIAVPAESRM